jgi:hypothetical protein
MEVNDIIDIFMEVEEKNFLLKKKAFELIKLSAEIEKDLELIADRIYLDEE